MKEVKLQKHPAYRDSGVEWLGEIPEHWEVKKLKMITSFINRGVTPNYVENSNYKVINQATFSKGYFDLLNIKFTKDKDFSGLNFSKGIVERNDILLASTGGGVLGKVAFVDFDDNTFQADSHVTIIRGTEPEFMSKYYYYILSISYELINGILAQGSTNQTELQRDWLINFKFPVPTFSEQTTISAYLDHKTAQIESAIGIKQKQIELLKERRQILIHRAVTRGLNPNVKLKDSGLEWIGEIPEGWEVVPMIKYASRVDYRGKTPEKVDSGIILVTTKNIKGGKIDYDISKEFVLEKDYAAIMSRGLPEIGDILFTMEAPLGMAAVVDNTDVAIAQRIIKFHFDDKVFNSYFVNQSIQSEYFQKILQREATGSTAQGIKASKLHKLKIIKPPLKEQIEIVSDIETNSLKISTAISLKEKEIEKLKEYKSVLINAAVSGKIKVG